jgi:hypothetical protein
MEEKMVIFVDEETLTEQERTVDEEDDGQGEGI